MTTYKLLQIFVLSYTGFVALFVLTMTAFEIRYGFGPEGKLHFFQLLNRLHGRTTVLLPFRVISVLFVICWLSLALPWIDSFIGTNLISSFTQVNEWSGIKTWFGTITDQGNAGAHYFITVFVSMLGVRGYFLVKQMADTLSNDKLAVSSSGRWGGTKDLRG